MKLTFRVVALARLQARQAPSRSPPPRRADPGEASGRDPAVLRLRQAHQDFQPRPESGRHPEARRTGPHARRACPADDVRHPVEQGRGAAADGQAAMRHADPSLTANVYTDPKLLDCMGHSTPCRPCLSTRGQRGTSASPSDGHRRLRPIAVALPVTLIPWQREDNRDNR